MASPKVDGTQPGTVGISRAIKHPRQLDATKELLFMLHHGSGFEILMLVGPTGAGKSVLSEKLLDKIVSDASDEMERDPDHVPAIRTTAVASGHRAFDWKGLYREAAKEVGDPFARERRLDRKGGLKGATLPRESPTTANLRYSLQKEFELRRTKFWIIDEAQHIFTGAKAAAHGDQFDVLKSVAQTSKVKIVLVGPYSLLPHVDSSAQLARRTNSVNLARYQSTGEQERSAFGSCVVALFKRLPLDSFPDVTANLDFFYAGSAGCVGVLKEWFERATNHMLQTGGGRALQMEHLRKTRLRKPVLEKIWTELRDGEALLDPGTDEEIGALEALTAGRRAAAAVKQTDGRARKPEKPGTRSPSRDPVPAHIGAGR